MGCGLAGGDEWQQGQNGDDSDILKQQNRENILACRCFHQPAFIHALEHDGR